MGPTVVADPAVLDAEQYVIHLQHSGGVRLGLAGTQKRDAGLRSRRGLGH